MSDNPFAGLNDTLQERTQREKVQRQQTLRVFRKKMLLILGVLTGAAAGAACAALTSEGGTRYLLGYVLGAVLGGLAGAIIGLGYAACQLVRQSVRNESFGEEEESDPARMLFGIMTSATVCAAGIGAVEAADMIGARGEECSLAFLLTAAGAVVVLLPAIVTRVVEFVHGKRPSEEE